MKRDMELVRKILFEIENSIDNVAEYNLKIQGYSVEQIAYHCAILYEGGYIFDYEGDYGSDNITGFGVGRLTWEGHDFLDKIREDTVWNKTKETIASKGLPFVFDIVKSVSSGIISGLVKTAIQI
ncbi:DUF2513 domain-containing protein [Robinsoniella peoriensis]|uniref:DUF2513 domain-containing protein n=1 Tax=Robinsoniella peoriensis TaxID=180332 RepID=UPI0005C7D009|nr:DUF2513 domain-containing protein [Robinsoniella peoriensis]